MTLPKSQIPIQIRDIYFVGNDELIIFRTFHDFPSDIVVVARL